jgi:hypothetical protein
MTSQLAYPYWQCTKLLFFDTPDITCSAFHFCLKVGALCKTLLHCLQLLKFSRSLRIYHSRQSHSRGRQVTARQHCWSLLCAKSAQLDHHYSDRVLQHASRDVTFDPEDLVLLYTSGLCSTVLSVRKVRTLGDDFVRCVCAFRVPEVVSMHALPGPQSASSRFGHRTLNQHPDYANKLHCPHKRRDVA